MIQLGAMPLFALGINHATAAVALRERLAFAPEALPVALQQLLDLADEVVILSTCNRTELVVSGEVGAERLLQWLADFHHIERSAFAEHIYCHRDQEAVRHLIRVASGLDSMVLGEPQIFGQMKSAYAVSQRADAIGSEFELVFRQVFSTAKKVRSDTAIGENPVSVAFAAVSLARRIFADLSSLSVLLIGAGDTIELVARHLREAGVRRLSVANRTLDRAQLVADTLSGSALLLADVPEALPDFDVVISSTASQLPVLGKGAVEQALKARKRRPIFMLDIAVPRDIEPQVSELADVFLYTVDDLRDIVDQNVNLRRAEVDKAAEIIDGGVAQLIASQRVRDVADVVVSYRHVMQALRDRELDKAQQALSAGKPADQVLQAMAYGMMQKVMHYPSAAMRRAAARQDDVQLAAAKALLGLDGSAGEHDTPPDAD